MSPAVYVQTNDAIANEIVAFSRAEDGALTPLGRYSTGDEKVEQIAFSLKPGQEINFAQEA